MKQLIFITLFFLISESFYSQDLEKLYESKVLENVKLKDSITNLKVANLKEKNELIGENKTSFETIEKLNKELKNVKDLKDKKSLTDSIAILNDLIINLNGSIETIKQTNKNSLISLQNEKTTIVSENNILKSDKQKFTDQNKKIFDNLNQKYSENEQVISKYDFASVNSDLKIYELIPNKSLELESKIKNWIVIKNAELLLSKNFNKSEIQLQIDKLSKLPQSNFTIELIKYLTDYESKNESIKKLISNLEIINKLKAKGTDRSVIEDKQNEIYVTIYFETESIDLNKYVYLNKVVSKIYKFKEDIDASVIDVLKDL